MHFEVHASIAFHTVGQAPEFSSPTQRKGSGQLSRKTGNLHLLQVSFRTGMNHQRTERIGFLESFRQATGKKQYILFADTGIETGCQTAGGRYIYQFPVSLCRKVHLTMRCQQLQRRDTDNGRIGKQPPGQGSYTQTGTLIHGKFPDNGIHISAVVHHRINAQANVAKSNVRGVEAYRTPRATGIIIDRSSSQQEFSPAIELVFQVGSSVRNLSISYMGFQPHGVQWHL